MPISNSPNHSRWHWKSVVVVIVVVCLIVDLLPHHGAPHFRYTGSDPAYAVWNLGWPFASFIYDPRSDFHIGPLAYVVLSFQLLLVAAVLIVRERTKKTPNLEA